VHRWSALFGAAALCVTLATSGVASPVGKLREQQRSLAGRERSAVLDLYALESRLAQSEERLRTLRAQLASTEVQLTRLRIELDVAFRSLYFAEERLGDRIRQLYVNGQLDPVAILLGAESLDEAVDGIESLHRLADSDRELVGEIRRARNELAAAKRGVAVRANALRAAESQAAATSAALRTAAAERRAYVARLARERGFTRRAIARAEAVAESAHTKAEAIVVASTSSDTRVPEAPIPLDGRQLTVVATGYAIHGRTATGIPTGWGVVAVDPSVIPLGTRMTIPGYGEGVAADTGGAVQGNTIDIWFPTVAEALAWGRRTVTITLHP
jgi:peptidoglycan DL-endopeptidase CwlO